MSELSTSPKLSTSPPKNPALQRTLSSEERTRKSSNSYGDTRWRTASFTTPGRVILIAVDDSVNAKAAFNYFVKEMHRFDDLLVITHIPEPPQLPSFTFRGGFNVPAGRWKEIMDEANVKVLKLEGDYETDCITSKLRYKIRGEYNPNAGAAIVQIAEQEAADAIVIGTRGLSGAKRALLGSVSDYVVRHSSKPVLVVPYTGGKK